MDGDKRLRAAIETLNYFINQAAVLLTVGRSYVGNDVAHSTLLDRACAFSYKNLPKYRSYRGSNTAPGAPDMVLPPSSGAIHYPV